MMDKEVREIAEHHHASMIGQNMIAIVERNGHWEIHQHSGESVWPISVHATKRAVASRVLQLLQIGPVAPQTHPETACIGSVA